MLWYCLKCPRSPGLMVTCDEDSIIDKTDLFRNFADDNLHYLSTPLNPGLYILYECTDEKYYVGCILATLPEKRQVRFLQKSQINGSFVTFSCPEEPDEPIIDVEKCSKLLPNPIPLRRGNIQYPCYEFNEIKLESVY